MDIFESIKRDVARTGVEMPGGKRWFEYKLPRGCGATTFMVQFANERASAGEKVLYLETRAFLLDGRELHENVKGMPASGGYHYWLHLMVYPETKWDWIMCDNLTLLQKPEWFKPILRKGVNKGIIWIDNIEGEYIKPEGFVNQP